MYRRRFNQLDKSVETHTSILSPVQLKTNNYLPHSRDLVNVGDHIMHSFPVSDIASPLKNNNHKSRDLPEISLFNNHDSVRDSSPVGELDVRNRLSRGCVRVP
jgi:hypothetical protein